ncbi:gluconokinase/xylulokinase [Mesorhizobium sp. YR577]|nr:gluconokinase/xylulokinase [Mesorhizobium sp. YR577]
MSASDGLLVGIDIGTTNLKVVAARPGGRVEAVVRRSMVIDRPAPGAAEFNLDALDRDIVSALSELVKLLTDRGIATGSIAGIGIASIGESFVGLDGQDRRVTPCPTWYDRRTANRRRDWGLSEHDWFDITGMVDDDIYTAYRIAWWRDAGAKWFTKVQTWLMVADYVTFRLCGRKVTSPSLGARSGMADRRSGAWSEKILDHVGLKADALGTLLPSATVAGGLLDEIASATGLIAGTPVVNAGHDHPCAGLGCGLVNPGRMIDSTGTSEALKTVVTRPLTYDEVGNGRYDCYPHVVPDRSLLSGHIPSSGGLIDWLVKILSGPNPSAETADLLWRDAASVAPGAGGIKIGPFLEGTGAPWNDRGRRADISFLGTQSTSGAILRAGVEGLAGWLRINLEQFEAITGTRPDVLTLTGGGARNMLANGIKAAVLERRFVVPDIEEAAGVGAGLVAGLATGVFADATQAAELADVTWRDVEIDPQLVEAYRKVRASITAHLVPSQCEASRD